MRDEQFRTWLEHCTQLQQRPIADVISRCKRIERIPGVNLDDEYLRDGGRALIDLLSYSAEDKRLFKSAPEGLSFSKGADLKSGLSSLRNAASHYFDFCKQRK